MKFVEWDGKGLVGQWVLSFKIDGVNARRVGDTIVTKNGKPLYNLPEEIIDPGFEVAEIYCGSWNETMSIVMASKSPRRRVKPEEIFSLIPLDPRLQFIVISNPSAAKIKTYMLLAGTKVQTTNPVSSFNVEGLVLYNAEQDLYVKVKPKKSSDVKIIGFVQSTAKSHEGALKEFVTENGKVGTGISTEDRRKFWRKRKSLLGTTIEVEYMEMTKNNKFRHPRFLRLRPDKS